MRVDDELSVRLQAGGSTSPLDLDKVESFVKGDE